MYMDVSSVSLREYQVPHSWQNKKARMAWISVGSFNISLRYRILKSIGGISQP